MIIWNADIIYTVMVAFGMCGIISLITGFKDDANTLCFVGLCLILLAGGIYNFTHSYDEMKIIEYNKYCAKMQEIRDKCTSKYDDDYCIVHMSKYVKDSISMYEEYARIMNKYIK